MKGRLRALKVNRVFSCLFIFNFHRGDSLTAAFFEMFFEGGRRSRQLDGQGQIYQPETPQTKDNSKVRKFTILASFSKTFYRHFETRDELVWQGQVQ